MAYSDTPLANETLKASQSKIRTNYSDIQTAFSVNHSPISGDDNGKHTKVLFPDGAAQVAAASQIVMYAKTSTDSGDTELFINKTAVANDGIPFTAYGSNVIATFTVYWTFLPSGILFKFGKASFATANSAEIDLNLAGPQFASASIYSVLTTTETVTPIASGASFGTGANFAKMTLHKATASNVPVSFFVVGLGIPTP